MELMKYLQQNMNGFTISYNNINNKYKFIYTEIFSFLNSSTCKEIIGIELLGQTSINNILISTNCINLQTHHCICINSNLITASLNNTNKNDTNIICSIPIQGNPFSMLNYTNHNNLKYNLFKNTISSLRLKLCDQNNKCIDLNGCHFSISIQLEIVKFVI